MARLTGKVAIVTGASRGIGREIARLFAAEGAKVVCAARTLHEGDHRLPGSLAGTVAEIRAAGGEAMAVTADVSSEADCIALVDAARRAYGPIDILVNNAALTYYIPTADVSDQSLDARLRGERARAVHAVEGGAARHDRAAGRRDRQHQLGRGDRTRARAVCRQDGARRRAVRHLQGGAGALHPGAGAGGGAV